LPTIGRLTGKDSRKSRAQLVEPLADRAGVPPASVGQRENVRRSAELLGDLEGDRLLALAPERVQGVHERVRTALGQLECGLECLTEASAHLEEPRAERTRLPELPRP